MEKVDNVVKFQDEEGNITELEIIFTYKNEERNREYVFFYADQDIVVGYLGDNNEILDVEDDDEYDELDEVLESFFKEHSQNN